LLSALADGIKVASYRLQVTGCKVTEKCKSVKVEWPESLKVENKKALKGPNYE